MDPAVLEELQKIARQKAIIRILESSNGKNLQHQPLTSGPNAGQTAGGAYGIVPNSLKDFANQSMNRNIGVDPDILTMMDNPADQVTNALNTNRELDDKAAEMALRLINAKTGGDEDKTAYAWRTGHNQSDEAMEKGAKTHPYVQAYEKQKDLMADTPQNREPATEDSPMARVKRMLGM